jgi:hypothetical protein
LVRVWAHIWVLERQLKAKQMTTKNKPIDFDKNIEVAQDALRHLCTCDAEYLYWSDALVYWTNRKNGHDVLESNGLAK